ncbi:DUF7144 family membrane protein [Catelliglobosispora koreensis]|uniref:DUF7144 family membrane protein n=1 Tax=Catelliglobosispora koreensis TaxID=129052 RepID=UPI00037BF13F|nr:hypothetical protein [Catelliglobosispora koreensis]
MTDSQDTPEVLEEYELTVEEDRYDGWVLFAALLMLLTGVFNFIEGLVSLMNDNYRAVISRFGVLVFGLNGWGWIHLIFGLALIAIGVGLLMGLEWSVPAAIAAAGGTAVLHMLYLFTSPYWSLVVIALCIAVIYGLTVKWRSV